VPRIARLVVPDVPHHIVQRGNRREPVFFCEADRTAYLRLLRERCAITNVRCLAWCLMDNHIHLILVPQNIDDLRRTLAPVHTRYAHRINGIKGWSGHLFEGRYWSYPMDDAHLMQAARYIENNPVAAGLVANAADWTWSSARAHITGQDDGLTDFSALGQHVGNWAAYLADGVNAMDRNEEVERALRAGVPLGDVSAGLRG
jgi:putative transposase